MISSIAHRDAVTISGPDATRMWSMLHDEEWITLPKTSGQEFTLYLHAGSEKKLVALVTEEKLNVTITFKDKQIFPIVKIVKKPQARAA